MRLGEGVREGDERQGPLPKIFLLVVRGEPGTQITGLPHVYRVVTAALGLAYKKLQCHLCAFRHRQEFSHQTARHLDHLHNARRDLSDADAPGSPAGRNIWMVLARAVTRPPRERDRARRSGR